MPANRKLLTEKNVLNLPVKRTPYRVWDAGTDAVRGLHVLVQPTGTRTFRVLWRYPGSRVEHTASLGRVGEISVNEARTKARKGRGLAANGHDPTAGDPAKSPTFKKCVEDWTKQQKNGKERVSAEATCRWMIGRTKAWHDRPIATISYADVETMLHRMRDGTKTCRPVRHASNRMYAHFNVLFGWCAKRKPPLIPANPIADMEEPWNVPKESKGRKRDWFKGESADDAIRKLWRFAEKVGDHRGKFIKMLIITGKRRGAVEKMRWEQIDATWFWMPVPGSASKRNRAIPLPRLAQRVLGLRQASGRVIRPIEPDRLAKRIRTETSINDFLFHGIRHVVATKLKELKVKPHIARLLLDHVAFNDAHAGYEHSDDRDELLEGLERWCAHIESLTSPTWRANLRRRAERLAMHG